MAEECVTNSGPVMCVIHSGWCLTDLDDFLAGYGDVPFLKIVHDKGGKETNRTITIISQVMYQTLCDHGYGDARVETKTPKRGFRITPYVLHPGNLPGADKTSALFVPIPKELNSNAGFLRADVVDKLEHIAECGMIVSGSWNINLPIKSRETGEVTGCFIMFNRDVPIETVAKIRVLITDTYWSARAEDKPRHIFRCFWARSRTAPQNQATRPGLHTKMTEQNVQELIDGLQTQEPTLDHITEPIPDPKPEGEDQSNVQAKLISQQPIRLT